VRVLEGVATSVDGAAQFGISQTGTAVFLPALQSRGRRLIAVDRSVIAPLAAQPHAFVSPRVSPDGHRMVVGIGGEDEHLWVYDFGTGSLTQLTFDAANRAPIWTSDGQRITFASNRSGAMNIFSIAADGRGTAERITTSEYLQLPSDWSPDGAALAFVEQNPSTGRDIWLLRSGSERTAFANSKADESAPRFSPDGRWIAYVSDESGQAEIYAAPATGAQSRRQISTGGGTEPVWRRDGRALLFRARDGLRAAPVLDSTTLKLGPTQVVFSGAVENGSFDAAGYDVTPTADRFVMIASAANSTPTDLRLILNWSPARLAR
jgi:Tol biopolymer transport system component